MISVNADAEHRFSKPRVPSIELEAGIGVVGDAHAGATVQHRYLVAKDPDRPNLRQVHLVDTEFLDLAAEHGFDVEPGDLGENITTTGLLPLSLPKDTIVRIGADVVLRVTGLRNPCSQINEFRPGLLKVALCEEADGTVARRVGIMAVVDTGGRVQPGDGIVVELPAEPHEALPVL